VEWGNVGHEMLDAAEAASAFALQTPHMR